MLEQFAAVIPGTLTPVLLVVSPSVTLAVDEGRDKPAGLYWRLVGLIINLTAAIVFAGLHVSAVINQRVSVNYPVLWCAITADILTVVMVVFVHHITTNWQQYKVSIHITNAMATTDIALALFYTLSDVILQLTIWVEPGETAFTLATLLRALGFPLGVAMSIIVATIFRTIRTTTMHWASVVVVTTMMVILPIQHFTGLVQILQARGFSMNHTMFVALAWSISQSSTMIVAQALVFLIPAVASIVAGFRTKTHDVSGANKATLRRYKVFRRHAITVAVWGLIVAIGVTATLTMDVAVTHQVIILSSPEAYSLKNGVVAIPFSQVEGGHLYHFKYKAKDGTIMRSIIIRKNGSACGVGLGACKNCGDAGYYEKDGKIICKKCEVAINLTTIDFKGGCNPIPLPYKIGYGKIAIQTTDLDALGAYFRWIRQKIRIMFFLRMIIHLLTRQLYRCLLIALTVCLSAAVPVSMLGVVFDVGNKLNAGLSTYGSNIIIQFKADAVVSDLYSTESGGATSTSDPTAFLEESDAAKIKTIFWSSNTTSLAPQLNIHVTVNGINVPVADIRSSKNFEISTGEVTVMGMEGMRSWWRLDGKRPRDDPDQGVTGKTLASGLGVTTGDTITLNKTTISGKKNEQKIKLTGVYDSDDKNNGSLYIASSIAQVPADLPDSVGKIEVKALTMLENDLARKVAANPAMLSQEEWETWYYTVYPSSIIHQIEEVIPGVMAKQAYQTAALQGNALQKTQAVMTLVTMLDLIAAAVAVTNLMVVSIGKRLGELMSPKALGVTDAAVSRLMLVEIAAISLLGAIVGALLSSGVTQLIGRVVFGSGITVRPMVFVLVFVPPVVTVLLASASSIRSIPNFKPVEVLHGC